MGWDASHGQDVGPSDVYVAISQHPPSAMAFFPSVRILLTSPPVEPANCRTSTFCGARAILCHQRDRPTTIISSNAANSTGTYSSTAIDPTKRLYKPFVGSGRELSRPTHPLREHGPLSQEDADAFYRQGYVVVCRLVTGDLLARARSARAALPARKGGLYASLRMQLWNDAPVFYELATDSPLGAAAAQLTTAR